MPRSATARYLAPSGVDADDVVADAFAGVWGALRNGHGPQDDFRSYLMACVRNACRSRRTRATPLPADIIEDVPGGRLVGERPLLEDPERYVEADTVARAFATLTPRWQHALWVTAVEERSPADVSRELKLSPNATAALTMRARQAFASAYLAEHVSVATDPACAALAPLLAPYVRDRLGVAERARVEEHLAECIACTAAVDDLRDLNSCLRTLLPATPSTLIAAATLPAIVGGTTAISGGALGVSALVLKVAVPLLLLVPAAAVVHHELDRRDDGATAGAAAAAVDTVASVTSPAAPATTAVVSTTAAAPSTTVAPTTTEPPTSTTVRATIPATTQVVAIVPPVSVTVPRHDPLGETVTTVAAAVGQVREVLEPVVDPLVDAVVPVIAPVVRPVATTVGALTGPLFDRLYPVVDNVASPLAEVLANVTTPVVEVVGVVAAPAVAVVDDVTAPVAAVIEPLTAPVWSSLFPVADAVSAPLDVRGRPGEHEVIEPLAAPLWSGLFPLADAASAPLDVTAPVAQVIEPWRPAVVEPVPDDRCDVDHPTARPLGEHTAVAAAVPVEPARTPADVAPRSDPSGGDAARHAGADHLVDARDSRDAVGDDGAGDAAGDAVERQRCRQRRR